MLEHCFKRLEVDHCVYIKRYGHEKYIILLLHVDDMLVIGHNKNMINKLKKDLGSRFGMKDLRPTQQILGIEIIRDRKREKIMVYTRKIR